MADTMVKICFSSSELKFCNMSRVNGRTRDPDPGLLILLFSTPHLGGHK